jgi:hypothetical protein
LSRQSRASGAPGASARTTTGVVHPAPSAAEHAAPAAHCFVDVTAERKTGFAPGQPAVEFGTPASRRPKATYASAATSYVTDTAVSAKPEKGIAGGAAGSAAAGEKTMPSGDVAARTKRAPSVSDSYARTTRAAAAAPARASAKACRPKVFGSVMKTTFVGTGGSVPFFV